MSVLFYHEDHEMILVTLGAELREDIPYNLIDALTLIDMVNENYEIPKEETVVKSSVIKQDVVVSSYVNYNTIIFLGLLTLLVVLFLTKWLKRRKQK